MAAMPMYLKRGGNALPIPAPPRAVLAQCGPELDPEILLMQAESYGLRDSLYTTVEGHICQFYRNTCFHLHMVCDCFCAMVAELSSCDRGSMAPKA